MLTFEDIKATAQDGAKYWAIGENGRRYPVTYSTEYFGGILFCCIPAEIEIIGYEEI